MRPAPAPSAEPEPPPELVRLVEALARDAAREDYRRAKAEKDADDGRSER